MNDADTRILNALAAENAELREALIYCARTLESLCPDTSGTPAAQHARELLEGAKNHGARHSSIREGVYSDAAQA